MFNSITLLSNKRSVHFVRPSGGCEQAKAMSRASFSPSKMRGTGGVARCLRFNTASMPPCANCCRTRDAHDRRPATEVRKQQRDAEAEVKEALVELIKEAFAIRNQLLSGSDDSRSEMRPFG